MKVINTNAITKGNSGHKTWLHYWVNESGEKLPAYCAEIACTCKPEFGAHVQKDNDDQWYVIPLCRTHNSMKGRNLEIVTTTLVPVQETGSKVTVK